MIRGTEMAEWKGNERGQLSFVPSWQTVKRLTLETILVCVFLCLTDFNNLPGQSCRYSTFPILGLCPRLCCVTLNSSAFTAFSSSHNHQCFHPPGMSLISFCWPLVRPCLDHSFYCYCCCVVNSFDGSREAKMMRKSSLTPTLNRKSLSKRSQISIKHPRLPEGGFMVRWWTTPKTHSQKNENVIMW